MKKRRRTEITLETYRRFVIQPERWVLAWCAECGEQVRKLRTEEAVVMSGVSARAIHRWVETGRVHFTETPDGFLLICLNSLIAMKIESTHQSKRTRRREFIMGIRKILFLVALIAVATSLLQAQRAQRLSRADEPQRPVVPQPSQSAMPIGTTVRITPPLGLPPVPIPKDNPPTAETIALGRKLYYDPMLSADNTIACATCHSPKIGFTDGKPVSTGIRGQKGGRSAPSVWNAAYYTTQFWDGRAPSLEKQAEGPVQNPIEMGNTPEGAMKKLAPDASYRAAFEKAFGPGPITYEKAEKAIASFERTVISGNSPFDRYFYGADKKALSKAAQRGLEVFRNPKKGNCTECHTIGEKYALFTDNKFHNLGVGVISLPDRVELGDLGRYQVTKKDADRGAFKTSSLRNIALTAPYMHDGSLKTLKDVVDFYVGASNSNPHRDPKIKALDFLTGREREDLVAFMESLTGEIPPNVGPPKPKQLQAGK